MARLITQTFGRTIAVNEAEGTSSAIVSVCEGHRAGAPKYGSVLHESDECYNWLQAWLAVNSDNYDGFFGLRTKNVVDIAGDSELLEQFVRGCYHHNERRIQPVVGKKPPRVYLSGAYTFLWFLGFNQKSIALMFDRAPHNIQLCIRTHTFYDCVKTARSIRALKKKLEKQEKSLAIARKRNIWLKRINQTKSLIETLEESYANCEPQFRSVTIHDLDR
jgi:hypothetical protein